MNHLGTLAHEELKALHKAGKVKVRANMSMSMHICDRDRRIPGATRVAHQLFKWIGLLMFIGGLVSIFFIKWYWALAILLFSFPVINASRQSAGQFVVKAALNDEEFYHDMLAMNALLITEK